MEPDRMGIEKLGADPFWRAEASEDLGGLHLLQQRWCGCCDPDVLAGLSRAEVRAYLENGLRRAEPGLGPERLRQRADRIEASLVNAACERAGLVVRDQARRLLRAEASRLQAASASEAGALAWLASACGRLPPGPERIGFFESHGFARSTAEGLEVLERLRPGLATDRLRRDGRVALPQRVLTSAEVRARLQTTAGALRRLADRLGAERPGRLLAECPQLTRGLLSGLPADSFLAGAIRHQAESRATLQAAGRTAGAAASLLLDIGFLVAGGWGYALKLGLDGLLGADTVGRAEERYARARLLAAAGADGAADLAQARRTRLAAEGRVLSALMLRSITGTSAGIGCL